MDTLEILPLLILESRIRKPDIYSPALGEHNGHRVFQDPLLVGDVLHDVLGPVHQVPDLVARRRAVHAPLELFLHFFPQNPLKKEVQKERSDCSP